MTTDRDNKYKEVLSILPKEIIDKFILPLSNKDPQSHDAIVRFLMVINEKGYSVQRCCKNIPDLDVAAADMPIRIET